MKKKCLGQFIQHTTGKKIARKVKENRRRKLQILFDCVPKGLVSAVETVLTRLSKDAISFSYN